MTIILNGKAYEIENPMTLQHLLERFEIRNPAIAVGLNENIVPRNTYGEVHVSEGDRIDIVHFMAGG